MQLTSDLHDTINAKDLNKFKALLEVTQVHTKNKALNKDDLGQIIWWACSYGAADFNIQYIKLLLAAGANVQLSNVSLLVFVRA